MKEIKLDQKLICLVDDEDFERLNKSYWHPQKAKDTFYVTNRGISMHRLLMNAKKGEMIDHINRNGLDNRKENLRICSGTQNQANSKKRRGDNSSRFKGVYFNKQSKKWASCIHFKSKTINLGLFTSEFEAYEVYQAKARELFGEFARFS